MKYNVRFSTRSIKYAASSKKRGDVSLFLIAVLALSIALFSAMFFEHRILPLANALAKTKAEYITNQAINTAVLQYLNENDVKYSDLCEIERKSNGEVSTLVANAGNMNRMKSQILDSVQDNLINMNYERIEIPAGALLGSDLLVGLGPKIPIKLMLTNSCVVDFKDNFSAAGINQTKHEVYIEVAVTVNVLMTQKNISATITNSIPVAQTIIVGDVPQAYVTGLIK